MGNDIVCQSGKDLAALTPWLNLAATDDLNTLMLHLISQTGRNSYLSLQMNPVDSHVI